ncbi:MAG: GNAT family N-acetyltransferase [Candidatus Ratteibacteria bacterium]|nr:GNAT family N-acetyltransferase [Candidatus Ratteibacteria bacterium]
MLDMGLYNFWSKITGYRKEKRRFKEMTGYDLNLKSPRSFSEKIVWKKLYDRNPLLPIVADKYKVRFYIKEVLGEENARRILVPILYVTDRPETIPFDKLPEEYIIKPNHASGWHIIVEKDRIYIPKKGIEIKKGDIVYQCRKWLRKSYGVKKYEWAYQPIKRRIIIEKLMKDREGKPPTDYKFFIIHGKCHLIHVIYDRFANKTLGMYTPDWEYLDVKGKSKQAPPDVSPPCFQQMLDISEKLGSFFDAIRVDFYLVGDRFYISELTNYHQSGLIKWDPVSFDFELGSKWQIEPGYWKKDPCIEKLARQIDNICDISIEKATDHDRPAIIRLLKQANMHYIPSPEMPSLTYENYFVARLDGRVVGFCGYKILDSTTAKTELMVVDRRYRNRGIGYKLQVCRMEDIFDKGIQKLITNTDLPETISWYKKHFGYIEVGKVKKLHRFGSPTIEYWTTLEVDLKKWKEEQDKRNVSTSHHSI